MSELKNVSSNPHIRSNNSTQFIMMMVVVALLPATGYGIYHFGIRALFVLCTTVVSALVTEFLFGLYKKNRTV